MNWFWLLRASRWARHPPSASRVVLVLAVIAVCLALYAVDRIWGWPDWLTTNGTRGRFIH